MFIDSPSANNSGAEFVVALEEWKVAQASRLKGIARAGTQPERLSFSPTDGAPSNNWRQSVRGEEIHILRGMTVGVENVDLRFEIRMESLFISQNRDATRVGDDL